MFNVPENINEILKEFMDGLHDILGVNLKQIILYGSYARGDYNDNSDVDIMILTDLKDKELRNMECKIWDLAYEIECENGFCIHLSPFLNNIEFFNDRANFVPFYKNVQQEGVSLNNG